MPALLVWFLALVGAAAVGAVGHWADEGAFRGSMELARLGGPWLLAGFVGGALAGWRRGVSGLLLGLVAGALIVGGGSVVYYALSWWEGGNAARRAAVLGIGWGAAGVGVGASLGLLGAAFTTRLGRRRTAAGAAPAASWLHGAALGTLGGLLIGEAAALLWTWDDPALRAVAALEFLGGAALVLAGCAGRTWRFVVAAIGFAIVSSAVAPSVAVALRESLRSIGWAGA